jgi:putative flippase GtrA
MHFDYFKKPIALFAGFSLVGIITTVLSMVLLFVSLKILQTPLIATYISIYILTIFLSFYLNSKIVFKTNISLRNGYLYFIIYASGLALGALLLLVFKKLLPYENWILSYMIIPFTLTSNFILSYKVLK